MALEDPAPISIIAMTAHAMVSDRDQCLAAGMNDYLSKPITVSSLVLALEKWLKPKESAPAPVESKKEAISTLVPDEPTTLVFDRAGLMERMMDDAELARTVIEGFLGDIPGQINQLKGHVLAKEVEGVAQQAVLEQVADFIQRRPDRGLFGLGQNLSQGEISPPHVSQQAYFELPPQD